jgi:hypothetical protein
MSRKISTSLQDSPFQREDIAYPFYEKKWIDVTGTFYPSMLFVAALAG